MIALNYYLSAFLSLGALFKILCPGKCLTRLILVPALEWCTITLSSKDYRVSEVTQDNTGAGYYHFEILTAAPLEAVSLYPFPSIQMLN